jgi:N-acetylmuramoyl-L-alanine amidase
MSCVINIGHCPKAQGASNKKRGLTEFAFNQRLADEIVKINPAVPTTIVVQRTYRDLPGDINKIRPKFIISLHCNAFNERATGTETLYFTGSSRGQQLARIVQGRLVAALGLPDRGIKPLKREDRGGHLVFFTDAPCVIAEPFFIDNDKDLEVAETMYSALVTAYADAIVHAQEVFK